MSDSQADPDSREERFNALLAEYLTALDAGRAPDRQSWIAEHAEFAEELEEFFTGSEQFQRLSESFHGSVVRTPEHVGAEKPRQPGTNSTQSLQATPNQDEPTSPWPASARPPALERFPPGTVLLGRYHVVNQLGKGGMGEAYRAFDLVLRQHVALKFLSSRVGLEPEILERFLNEVRLARPGLPRTDRLLEGRMV